MKVSLLKLFSGALFVAVLMSSCLGDGDNSREGTAFAYIDQEDGVKYASTEIGRIVGPSDQMSNLQVGQCYYIGFKVNAEGTTGYYTAEYINVQNNGKALTKSNIITNYKPYKNLPENVQSDSIHVSNLSIRDYSPYATPYEAAFKDNWVFSYSVKNLKEDDKIDVYFYYDAENQFDKDGVEGGFANNQIIIDVRFIKKEESGDGSGDTFISVGNFNALRGYTPKYDGNEATAVYVKFRYIVPYTDENKEVKYRAEYLGNWNSGYGMIYYAK
ncbi:hypothetical protein M2451_003651 [Dysgonomonas sp. PFB1-18]|uniref:hypothetical protein n=1 Tax=unclassified Dysgonomonas TaxID=2630389 RepID=UPI002475FAB0|nr:MULTISPECIES: hypothetical protein [unclassified Dysgonomonas]MDH6310840.1 hypothetical protein [Dysgonomonas sp. PF1-14]MDH6340722.1 hypothetical protein [Dysgonomonas sp. PF1-16]MDH6382310.1 hypothetical protein [Dysgonomonas sp. PFB1-18]MDH6399660.1 hypothetical protein [Dysgonomonas sp. PF1-23]